MPQAHIVLGAGDGDRQLLMLLIVSMKHRQLLLPMCGVVEPLVASNVLL